MDGPCSESSAAVKEVKIGGFDELLKSNLVTHTDVSQALAKAEASCKQAVVTQNQR